MPPYSERDKDPEYHYHYGKALSLIVTAIVSLSVV
jgi:hypothetical protein